MRGLVISAVGLGLIPLAHSSDHNNLDKKRPLAGEDASSIAFGALEFQSGIQLGSQRRNRPAYHFRSELQYGFAPNRDLSVSWEPVWDLGAGGKAVSVGEVSYFEMLRRETNRGPALAYRIELESADGAAGSAGGLRLISSQTVGRYGKLHLNLDAFWSASDQVRDRWNFGGVIALSDPIGSPERLDRTLIAELGVAPPATTRSGQVPWLGIGFRRQLSPTAVADYGIRLGSGSQVTIVFGRSRT